MTGVRTLRPGSPADLPALVALLAEEVRLGLRDCAPTEAFLRRQMDGFDWASRSRALEDESGLRAIALTSARRCAEGLVTRVEAAARDEADRAELIRWGLQLGRAAGASVGQVWRGRGRGEDLAELGLRPVRIFWRMDRPHLQGLPAAELPVGYQLSQQPAWPLLAQTYNQAFTDHWRHCAVDPTSPPQPPRPPELELLALTEDGRPAAVVWCDLEEHEADPRRQPVGVVSAVGTVPEHRCRGLASALTAEALRRLRALGAGSASLYVDALNPSRAAHLYRQLGFEVAFEYEVHEIEW